VNSWKCFVLSNGEKSIPTIMGEGGARYNAGQSVRLLDLPVERKYGVFDSLHHFTTGAELSDWIKQQSVTHYGLAGRAFLEKLTEDKRDFNKSLQKIKESSLFQVSGAQGQHKRAAARFALIALAGELATEYGITGWPKGTAFKAAAEGFRIWCSTRGQGNDEKRQILDQVLNFIERHGDSRFSSLNSTADITVRDRAGWWIHESETRIFLFTAGGMKEALKGFDLKRSLDILVSAGALPEPKTPNGERSRQRKIDGKNTKVYEINAEKLSNASSEF
jgi:putative DNA primase/helicase